MDCRTAPLCGVLTLETGLGGGKYQHDQPVVHGLWPQVDSYGSSSCTAPLSVAKPAALAACYAPTAPSAEAALGFERYEWGKHGVCAGTVDAADYLDQLCSLAAAPLTEMSRARRAGLGLDESAASLRQAGFALWAVDARHSQLELSACAGTDGRWKLAGVGEFDSACGSLTEGRPPLPLPPTRQGAETGPVAPTAPPPARAGGRADEGGATVAACLPRERGPPCSGASECLAAPGCVRCARSGYCTDQQLPTNTQ